MWSPCEVYEVRGVLRSGVASRLWIAAIGYTASRGAVRGDEVMA
jgi:hypothetical protein